MKFLLVNLPFYRLLGSHYNSINLGLSYTCASLNSYGADCWIYNADFLPGEYGDFKKIIKSSQDYKEYFKNKSAEIWSEVADSILRFNPDVVGYTAYTANLKAIDIVSEILKKKNKKIWQIVGGPHAILDSKIDKKLVYVDEFWHREGEYLRRLIRDIIPIDNFKFPEKNKIWNVEEKDKKYIDYSYIITSRGCPHNCKFCASPSVWKRKIRFRTVENVISEMEELKKKYCVNSFYILDDTFTLRNNRTKELLRQMQKLQVTWKCNTRLDCLDDETCHLMKNSGCIEAKVGVESGSERILKFINKNETKQDMLNGIDLLKKYNIPITCYLMTGFPTETNEELKQTIEFAKQISANKYSLSVFAPYYGSSFYEKYKDESKEDWEIFYHQSPKPIVNNSLSDSLLKEYYDLADSDKE